MFIFRGDDFAMNLIIKLILTAGYFDEIGKLKLSKH